MKYIANQKGMTLIELLAGMAIMLIIGTALFNFFIACTTSYTMEVIKLENEHAARTAMSQIVTDLRSAEQRSASQLGSTPEKAILVYDDTTGQNFTTTEGTISLKAYLRLCKNNVYTVYYLDATAHTILRITSSDYSAWSAPQIISRNIKILNMSVPVPDDMIKIYIKSSDWQNSDYDFHIENHYKPRIDND
ncbi:MAG: prepilin-type N-terminal cleavage/methylation domain-containing protein [Hyphomonadaceae bacterium]|nr:prepilin-type N-terminal cleavage/methylation domain-containing protein [Clostridia bacterium]